MASRLAAANASRSSGSTGGFGYLSGSIPHNDMRTSSEIRSTHELIKLANAAAMRGDWEAYASLQQQMQFN